MERMQLDWYCGMPCLASKRDPDDEAVFIDIDELIDAHPHLLEHLHLVGHEPDSALFAMPLPLREGVSGLKHNLGIKDRFDLLPPRRDVVAGVGLIDSGDPLLRDIDVLL